PNLPEVDPETKGAAQAVVFLRDVDLDKARPWDHAPVEIEHRDFRLHVRQGETDARVGFVRSGDFVEIVSRDPRFHLLQGRGAAFLSLPFPDANQCSVRRLSHKGLIELSSGAAYYWMRAYLFVDEQPYYTLTDRFGRFTLGKVPPGRYRLVC